MRASHAALAFVSFLVAAAAAWHGKRAGEDAELVAAAVAVLCVGGAAATLLGRRLVAGLCALVIGGAVWAATGGVGHWLFVNARWAVGVPTAIALFFLVLSSGPSARAGGARRA